MAAKKSQGMLTHPMPSIDDKEGEHVPEFLPAVVDAHVHLFPDHIFASIWKWFDQFGWPIRYKLTSPRTIDFLLSHGIDHIVALQYAHKPGIAREMNKFMADVCRSHPRVSGLATVLPGEKNAAEILKEGFEMGLAGVKLHAHVQCFDVTGKDIRTVYEACAAFDKPLLMHAGREPKSPKYTCDPYLLCGADKVEQILNDYPELKLCVPHMGADEYEAFQRLHTEYNNLWLDTTMTLSEYLFLDFEFKLDDFRQDRIIFGTDFPNLPYAWDREIKRLCKMNLPEESLALILGWNAKTLFSIQSQD